MKIIFLDIDGVLNNDFTKEKFAGFTGIDKRLRDMFLDWFKQQDYNIILSSSWRIPSAHGDFLQELQDNGIPWLDETPYLRGIGRGHEIEVSLEEYSPDAYVILDDMGPSGFLKHQRPRLVQTAGTKGLEPKKLLQIDKLMGYANDNQGSLGKG